MADSVNIQHKLQMLFETKLDDKSKQQVGKQIKGMLENAVISFDEAEAKRNLESVIQTLNKLFSKAEMEGFDTEKLLKMPSLQALQEMANKTTEDFQKAFDQALKKSGGIKIDFGTADMSEMTTPLKQMVNELADIGEKVASTTKKSVSEIEASFKTLKTDKKISSAAKNIDKLLTQIDGKKFKAPDKIEDAISKLTSLRSDITQSKADNDPWEVQYQHLLKYVGAYEAAQKKFGENLIADNPQLKDLYEILSPKAKTIKISLESFVDMARGNEFAEDRHKPWAREKTLQDVKEILQNGISVKGSTGGDSDRSNNSGEGGNSAPDSNPEKTSKPESKPKQGKKETVASSLDKFVREYEAELNNVENAGSEKAFAELRNKMLSRLSEMFKLKDTANDKDLIEHFELYELNGNDNVLKEYLKQQIEALISKATKSVDETAEKAIKTTTKNTVKKNNEKKPTPDKKPAEKDEVPSGTVTIDKASLKEVLDSVTYNVKIEGEKVKDTSEDNQVVQALGEISQKIDTVSRDETLQGIKATVDTALTKKDAPTNSKMSPEEKAEHSGNREQRFDQLTNIASMYEDVDDVEAAIQEFGKLYKEIILIGEESTKAIKPNKAGINTLKKIANGDIDLGDDYSWVEFKRANPTAVADGPTSNTSTVAIEESSLENVLGRVTYKVQIEDQENENAPEDNQVGQILGEISQKIDAVSKDETLLGVKSTVEAALTQKNTPYDSGVVPEAVKEVTSAMDALIAKAAQYASAQEFERANIKELKAVGVKSRKESSEIWKQGKLLSFSPIELTKEDAIAILREKVPDNILEGWFRRGDSDYKPKLEQLALSDNDIRNAALNIMWDNYKESTGKKIGFEDFLRSDIPMYRGKNSEKYVEGDETIAFTFDPKVAEKFGKYVLETIIKPIDTLGSYQTTGETETLVYRKSLEGRPEYSQWHDAMANKAEPQMVKPIVDALKDSLSNQETSSNENEPDTSMKALKGVLSDITYNVKVLNDDTKPLSIQDIESQAFALYKKEHPLVEDMNGISDMVGTEAVNYALRVLGVSLDRLLTDKNLEKAWGTLAPDAHHYIASKDQISPAALAGAILDAYKSLNLGESKIYPLARAKEINKSGVYSGQSIQQDQVTINEAALENVLSRITYNVKIKRDPDAPDSEKAALISAEELQQILNNIYNVKIDNDNTDKTANEITLNQSELKNVLNEVFKNILNPPTPQNDGGTQEPWARQDTLGEVKGVLENIREHTSKIGTGEIQQTATIDADSISTISDALTAIQATTKSIDDKVVKGTKANTSSNKKEVAKKPIKPKVPSTTYSPEKVETQKLSLKKFRTELETSGRLTDDLKKKFKGLAISLSKVKDGYGLAGWNEKFRQFQIQTKTDGIIDKANNKEVIQEYEKLITLKQLEYDLEKKYEKAKDGSQEKQYYQEQLKVVREVVDAQKIKHKNDEQELKLAKMREDAEREIGAIRAKQADKNLKDEIKQGEMNARMSKAGGIRGRAIDSITNVNLLNLSKEAKDNITQDLIDKISNFDKLRARIQSGDSTLTEDDIERFKHLQVEIDKASKELNEFASLQDLVANGGAKAIGENIQLNPANMESYRKALEDIVRTTYGGKATVGDFDHQTKQLHFTVNNGKREVTEYKMAWNKVMQTYVAIPGKTKKVEGVLTKILKKAKEFSAYFTGSSLIYKGWNALIKGVQYIREIDKALTELKKVTDETAESYDRFLDNAAKTADRVGSTVSNIVNSTADWARIGYSLKEAASLAESTAVLLNVSEFSNIEEATSALTSTLQAFSYTAEQSLDVVDVLNEVGKLVARR